MKFPEKLNEFLASQPPRKPPRAVIKRSVHQDQFFTFVLGPLIFMIGIIISILFQSIYFGIFISPPGLIIFLIGWISRQRQTKILVHGIKNIGHIENGKEIGTKNKKKLYKFAVHFEHDGKEHNGYFKAFGDDAGFYEEYFKQNKSINMLFRPRKKKVFPLDHLMTLDE